MKGIALSICSLVLLATALSGCNDGGDSKTPPSNSASTDYPYLLSAPRISTTPNKYDPAYYDITVEVDVAGPAPIYSVGLWIQPVDNGGQFDYLDLQYVAGNTWSATTIEYVPFSAGSYYIDSILIEDGDPLAGGLVRSGWYFQNNLLSTSHYFVDQRLTNWDPANLGILQQNMGVSNIPISRFTLP